MVFIVMLLYNSRLSADFMLRAYSVIFPHDERILFFILSPRVIVNFFLFFTNDKRVFTKYYDNNQISIQITMLSSEIVYRY